MSDVVNPVQKLDGSGVVNPIQQVNNWWDWDPQIGDMVACYGGDTELKRYWQAQQGQVKKVSGVQITVSFIPTVASDLSELVFHKKQLRLLKQAGGRTMWIRRDDLQKVKTGDDVVFSAQVSYQAKDEPQWIRCEQQTVEFSEIE